MATIHLPHVGNRVGGKLHLSTILEQKGHTIVAYFTLQNETKRPIPVLPLSPVYCQLECQKGDLVSLTLPLLRPMKPSEMVLLYPLNSLCAEFSFDISELNASSGRVRGRIEGTYGSLHKYSEFNVVSDWTNFAFSGAVVGR